jgi:hypothetical protein
MAYSLISSRTLGDLQEGESLREALNWLGTFQGANSLPTMWIGLQYHQTSPIYSMASAMVHKICLSFRRQSDTCPIGIHKHTSATSQSWYGDQELFPTSNLG